MGLSITFRSNLRVAGAQEKLGLSITFRVSRYQSNEILGLHAPGRSLGLSITFRVSRYQSSEKRTQASGEFSFGAKRQS